jgi:biotin carboxyl carrier protein
LKLFPYSCEEKNLVTLQKEEITVSDVLAPMGGKIIKVLVSIGETVSEDDELAILEAMKMEMPIVSPASGAIKEIKVQEGATVQADDVIMVLG